MEFLSTGVPFYDVVIAAVVGYFLAWFFVARPLRHQLEEDGTRNFEQDTELRTSNRSLDRMRGEVKGMQAKLTTTEATLASTRADLAKAQNELQVLTEHKTGTTAELETREQKINELQGQLDKATLDARRIALHADNLEQKANLAILAAENEAMKARVAARQMENQLLRIQTSPVAFQMATPMAAVAASQPHIQEAPAVDNSWTHSDFGLDGNWQPPQQQVPQQLPPNNVSEGHSPTSA